MRFAGRGACTYDTALGFAEYPYAGKRLFVMTHRPRESVTAQPSSRTVSDVVARIGDAQRVYVDGGNVIRQFFAANLIATSRSPSCRSCSAPASGCSSAAKASIGSSCRTSRVVERARAAALHGQLASSTTSTRLATTID